MIFYLNSTMIEAVLIILIITLPSIADYLIKEYTDK